MFLVVQMVLRWPFTVSVRAFVRTVSNGSLTAASARSDLLGRTAGTKKTTKILCVFMDARGERWERRPCAEGMSRELGVQVWAHTWLHGNATKLNPSALYVSYSFLHVFTPREVGAHAG